jgi:hypothetical protein
MTNDLNEHTLVFTKQGYRGDIHVLGVTLPKKEDFGYNPPSKNHNCWLSDKSVITSGWGTCNYKRQTASIRPLLVVEDTEKAGLRVGDCFQINGIDFNMVSKNRALSINCLNDECTFRTSYEEDSIIRYCLHGWYENMVAKNKLLHQANET